MPINKAIKLYDEGRKFEQQARLSSAERAYRKAIKINPHFVEALNNLGNILVDKKQLKEATVVYQKAIKLRPDHSMLLNNLGNSLQLQGENETAIEYFNSAIALEPNYADVYSNLGNAFNGLRDLDNAIQSYRKAISLDSNNKEAHNGLANVHAQNEEYDLAIESFQRALEVDPMHKEAYTGLGNVLSEQDKWEQAINCYDRAIIIDPIHKEAYVGLCRALRHQREFDKAVIAIRQAQAIDPRNASILTELGFSLNDQGHPDKAIATFGKAINIDPENASAYDGLGIALSDYGEIEQAEQAFRKAFETDPERYEAYRSLAKNKKFTKNDDDMRTMETLYRDIDIKPKNKMHLAFGLGKAYEDLKEYAKSIEFTIEANRIKWESVHFSIENEQDVFDNLKKTFSTDFFIERQEIGNPDPTPIFILGMIRSGTSLTEQILASHSDVYGAGELLDLSKLANELCANSTSKMLLDCLPKLEAETLGSMAEKYISAIRKHSTKTKHITDKMPQNFVFVGLIKLLFPNAKIIHCTRDPMDNCLSIFKNYFGEGQYYSYDMETLGKYYALYSNLMLHWESVLPNFVYQSNYESLIADPKKETQNLLEFCDLPWEESCLAFHKTKRKVNTASNAQVRQPIYKDSVELSKRYGDTLKPLENAIYGQSTSTT
jgi:tetratricopeptide (TPR) repeat protein